MTDDRDHLEQIAARLRDERPQADALELDRIKLRVLSTRRNAGRAWLPAAIHRYGKGTLMTSRIAITVLLTLGIMMSATGATLAVSGLAADQDSAAAVQYVPNDDRDEAGEQEEGGEGGKEQREVLGEQSSGGAAQAGEQAAAGGEGGNLAFTGFAALPLLVLGVGLFGAGVVMRRRARPDADA